MTLFVTPVGVRLCDICVLVCDTKWVVVVALDQCITACDAVAYCASVGPRVSAFLCEFECLTLCDLI